MVSMSYEQIVAEVLRLPPAERARLIAEVVSTLVDNPEPNTPKESLLGLLADEGPAPSAEEIDEVRREMLGYPAGYFEETYGSFAEDPLERNQPPHPDQRDEIE